ncbi:hypothetical protein BBJ28_00006356 [Nothophytophthora sp. Chile5]|nr:hypothetical protein BBJ28_00006356 [Nothophytophthora sp. Chile5]
MHQHCDIEQLYTNDLVSACFTSLSDEEEHPEGDDDEEFTPSTPRARNGRKTQSSGANSKGGSAKRQTQRKPRSLRPVSEDSKRKKTGGDGEADDGKEEEDEELFGTQTPSHSMLVLVLSTSSACGSKDPCVPETEPLAQLDMGDLVEYVVEDLGRTNESYPIASRGKGTKKFLRNFEEFWEVFVRECYESEILFTSEIISNFVDWLTTLSSSEVRAIRHTTSIAAFALGNALVDTAVSISEQLAVATRQLNAETNSPAKNKASPGVQKSPNARKVALLKDNMALYESRLQQVLKLVNLVFTGVVVHRYRDVMPEIRMVNMQCLGHWITTLPDQFLKDNFLKYLGWLLNDKASMVRVEVVRILRRLYENEAFTEKLELFTSRFLPRYLDMCNDVDNAVVQECIHLLIAVDKRNLISSDIELQPVEKLVFDADNEDIRKAAAEFVCLQYDAFGVAVSKTKSAKLKKEQLNTQAIALVEFAEEYIQNHGVPEAAVETLVDAFWGLDDCRTFDWRLMTNLLLVDKSAPDLSSEQQTILLRLLVASVGKLVQDDSDRGANEITVAFCKDIPSLFLSYQSDTDKLALLLQLIPMLTLKSEVIGHHSSHIKKMLEKLKHAYLVHSDEELLTNLALSITHLLQTEHASLKREAEVIVHELIQETLDKLDGLLEDDARLFETLATDAADTPNGKPNGKSKKKTRARKRKSVKTQEITNVEYSLRISLCRLKCLIRYLNIREYLPLDSSSAPQASDAEDSTSVSNLTLGRMDKLGAALCDLLRRRTRSVAQLDEGFRQVGTIKHSLMIVYSDLLWLTNPIFKSAEDKRASLGDPANSSGVSGDVDSTGEGGLDSAVRLQIQKVCLSRATLEEALVSVLEMHLAKARGMTDGESNDSQPAADMEELVFEDGNVSAYVKEAQRFAFVTFCDARCLFVEKFHEATPPYDALVWALPKVLILLTQMHFENEMDDAEVEEPEFEDEAGGETPAVAKEKAEAKRLWEEKQQRKAELLVALGRVSLCNPNKKHQAAAVLQYFTSNGKTSVEVVKAFGKQVKTEAPVRYLEIQMTALRQLFNAILVWKEELEAAEATDKPNEEASAEQEELKEKVEINELELKELARRFSQSLGVGKIASSLRAPFLRFLGEGVRFSLERPTHFEFLEAMRAYLSHLDKPSTAQLRERFTQRLEALSDIPDDGEDLDPRWRVVFDFQAAITTATSTNARKRVSSGVVLSPSLKRNRRSASSEPTPTQAASIAEEGEEEARDSDNEEDQPRIADNDAGGEAKGKRFNDQLLNDEGEMHVDHDSRPESPNHKRIAVAEKDVDSQEAITHRKRLRQQREAEDDAAFDEEGKTEEDSPLRRSEEVAEVDTVVSETEESDASNEQRQHKNGKAEEEEINSRSTRRKRQRRA